MTMITQDLETVYRLQKKVSDRLGQVWRDARSPNQTAEASAYVNAHTATQSAREQYLASVVSSGHLTEAEATFALRYISEGYDAQAAVVALAFMTPTRETSYHVLATRWEILLARSADDECANEVVPFLFDYREWLDASSRWHRLSDEDQSEACADLGPPLPPEGDLIRAELYFRASRMLEHPRISAQVRHLCLKAQVYLRDGADLVDIRSFWDYEKPIEIDAE